MPRDPKKINTIVTIDFESGGLFADKNPACSVAAVAINPITFEGIISYDNMIKPYDDKLIYEPKAMAVNGLTVDQLRREGLPLSTVVDDLCTVFTEANIYNSRTAMPIIAGHNIGFDLMFLDDIFTRCGKDLGKFVQCFKIGGKSIPMAMDTVQWNKLMRAPVTDNDTNFKLHTCCSEAGIQMEGQHSALEDTKATSDLLVYMVTKLRSSGGEISIEEGKVVTHRKTFEWA